MEEIAFDPPKAKNDVYWRSKVVNVISFGVRRSSLNIPTCSSERRKSGMLVARDCVIRKRVNRSWSGHKIPVISFSILQSFCSGRGYLRLFLL